MTIKTVVLGATGYVGGELLRLVAGHPEFQIAAAVSASQNGNSIASVFPHLQSVYPTAAFCAMDSWSHALDSGDDVAIFSAAPHGASALLVKQALENAAHRKLTAHVVDSSADFRYASAAEFEDIYGGEHAAPELLADFFCAVPEHHSGKIGNHAGHPGCFATAMLLAAVPLYKSGYVRDEVFVSAITGSTGSGRSPQAGTHHPERHGNLYAYKPLRHRHVREVQNLIAAASNEVAQIRFIPHSGPFARGIYATLQAPLVGDASRDDVLGSFDAMYRDAEFVKIVDGTPILKDVVASNYAHIGVEVADGTLVVMCAIDNLVKGAAGGAIQWMNRLWSLPETSGLTSPSPAWT